MPNRRITKVNKSETHRRIVMVAYDGANALDIVGPLDILGASFISDETADARYTVDVVSPDGGLISTYPSGVSIQSRCYKSIRYAAIDTLLVAGGEAFENVLHNDALLNWIFRSAKKSRRVASVCTGAFLLAAAGLLEKRRATTHWRWAERLQTSYPEVLVEPDRLYTKDGNVYTSAGITAGMDLALALVEEDFGGNVAREIARNWVIFAKRPGGQSQFSALLPESTETHNHSLEEVIALIHDNPEADLSIEALADFAHMSVRNFARRFRDETGVTPGKYVERIRLAAARSRLENSAESIESVAQRTGFINTERMRRTFMRHLRISPQDYRRRFQL